MLVIEFWFGDIFQMLMPDAIVKIGHQLIFVTNIDVTFYLIRSYKKSGAMAFVEFAKLKNCHTEKI